MAADSNDFNDVKIESDDKANNEDGISIKPVCDMFLRWCFNGCNQPNGIFQVEHQILVNIIRLS